VIAEKRNSHSALDPTSTPPTPHNTTTTTVQEYAEESKLRALVAKYSEFINFPIYMEVCGGGGEGGEGSVGVDAGWEEVWVVMVGVLMSCLRIAVNLTPPTRSRPPMHHQCTHPPISDPQGGGRAH